MRHRILKLGGFAATFLTASTLAYDYTMREVNYSKNLFLTREQQEKQLIPNKTFENDQKTVVVIGAGIAGVTSSYYLLQKGFNVILMDRRNEVLLETSYKNCCINAPSTIYPLVNWHNIPMVIKNMLNPFPDPEKGNGIFLSALFEPYFITFGINALKNLFFSSQAENSHKIRWMNKLSLDEFQKLFATYPEFKEHCDFGGTILLYKTEEDLVRYETDLKRENIDYVRVESPEEITKLERFQGTNANPEIFRNYFGGLYLPEEFMMDTFQLGKGLVNLMKQIYQSQFQLNLNETFDQFIIDRDSKKVVGVRTQSGKQIASDYVVVACAVNSKYIAGKLKTSVPVMPFKGYTVSFKLDEENAKKINFMDRISIGGSYLFMTKLKHEYRIAQYGQLVGGNDLNIDNYYTDYMRDKYKMFTQLEKDFPYTAWTGHRPLMPDDVCVVSKLPSNENVFVVTGLGGRGLTQSLGVGKVLSSLVAGEENENFANYDLSRYIL